MKEQFIKIIEQTKKLWTNLSLIQKITAFGVVFFVIVSMVMIAVYSSSPGVVSVLSAPVTDEVLLGRISVRMDKEGIDHQITNGLIYVNDKVTSQRVVSILASEDLLPRNVSPWDIFKMDRWTVTDFERNVNLRRAITVNLEQHLEAIEDIDSAKVSLVLPETELFAEDQKMVSASIIISFKPFFLALISGIFSSIASGIPLG